MVSIKGLWLRAQGKWWYSGLFCRCSLCGWREMVFGNKEKLIHVYDKYYTETSPIRPICRYHYDNYGPRVRDCLTNEVRLLYFDLPKWKLIIHKAGYWVHIGWRFMKSLYQALYWSARKWLEQRTPNHISA